MRGRCCTGRHSLLQCCDHSLSWICARGHAWWSCRLPALDPCSAPHSHQIPGKSAIQGWKSSLPGSEPWIHLWWAALPCMCTLHALSGLMCNSCFALPLHECVLLHDPAECGVLCLCHWSGAPSCMQAAEPAATCMRQMCADEHAP